jgi:hypothetical protein
VTKEEEKRKRNKQVSLNVPLAVIIGSIERLLVSQGWHSVAMCHINFILQLAYFLCFLHYLNFLRHSVTV